MHIRTPYLIVAVAFVLSGCGPRLLLEEERIKELAPAARDNHNTTLLYETTYRWNDDETMIVTRHAVTRIARERQENEQALFTYDNPAIRLVEFQARVIHANGSIETFATGDLTTRTLSTSHYANESKLKSVGTRRPLGPGDIVEVATIHENRFPQLGTEFSLSQLDGEAHNVLCTFDIPASDSLQYRVLNDSIVPVVDRNNGRATYSFRWAHVGIADQHTLFARVNSAPAVLAAFPNKQGTTPWSWEALGDWYLKEIRDKTLPTPELQALAESLTREKGGNREKMDAIFEYCQKNVRYEQVYMENGEIFPNPASVVLSRRYGDCKDYATLMYALARIVGLDPHLALCHRGRGTVIATGIPVSQFNHMVLYLADKGHEYWYDGTNRAGMSGIAGYDLANAQALVVAEGKSRLITICESDSNLLSIRGTFRQMSSGLLGTLAVQAHSQFATDFSHISLYLNREKMEQTLAAWLKSQINRDVIVRRLNWGTVPGLFEVTADVEIPNCITTVVPITYVQLDRLFPDLLPATVSADTAGDLCYFPGFNRVAVFVDLPEFMLHSSEAPSEHALLSGEFYIPAGPCSGTEGRVLLAAYKKARDIFSESHRLIQRTH